MKTGKLSETILKRSILRKLQTKRPEVMQGAGVGRDCALFSFPQGIVGVGVSSFTLFASEELEAKLTGVLNNAAAEGLEPVGLLFSLIFPETIEEEEIRSLAERAERMCSRLGIQIAGGDSRISPNVLQTQVSVTVLAAKEDDKGPAAGAAPGQEIVMTKWLGLAGTAVLARVREGELKKRLPARLVAEAGSFDGYASILEEAGVAASTGVSYMHDISRGGVFTALWELAEATGVGFEIDIRKIPVRQETIEVTEVLGLNPYELDGTGSLLIVTEHGEELVNKLEGEGIPATVIGMVTAGKAKVLHNREEKRYLDRPTGEAREEIWEGEIIRRQPKQEWREKQ